MITRTKDGMQNVIVMIYVIYSFTENIQIHGTVKIFEKSPLALPNYLLISKLVVIYRKISTIRSIPYHKLSTLRNTYIYIFTSLCQCYDFIVHKKPA